MKVFLKFLFVLILSFVIFSNSFAQNQPKSTNSKKETKIANTDLKEIKDEFLKISETVKNEFKALNKMLVDLENSKENSNKNFKLLMANIKDQFDNVTKYLLNTVNTVLQQTNEQLLKNQKQAENSYEQAVKLYQNGETEKARVYLLNAINHNPTNIKYIDQLMRLAEYYHISNDYDKIGQIKSVIELSLFQVNSNEIEKVLSYLEKISSFQNKILEQKEVNDEQEEQAKVTEKRWLASFVKFHNTIEKLCYDNMSSCMDYNKLSNRLTKIEDLLNTIPDSLKNQKTFEVNEGGNVRFCSYSNFLKSKKRLIKNILAVLPLINKIEKMEKLLSKEDDLSSDRAEARYLSASTALQMLMEYDIENLPTPFTIKISRIEHNFKILKNNIQKAKSQIYYDKAWEAIKYANDKYSTSEQDKIDAYNYALQEIISNLSNISYQDYRDVLKSQIKVLKAKIINAKKEQYMKYQKWASGVCLDMFKEITSEKKLKNQQAVDIFNNYKEFRKIDIRLVSPQISQIWNLIFQKLLNVFNAEQKYQAYEIVMGAYKKRLEDF